MAGSFLAAAASPAKARPYNLTTMPRWLIAVFTLHFLLSVGVSAFGKTPEVGLPQQVGTPAVQSVFVHEGFVDTKAEPAPAVQKTSVDAHGHGLADAHQDLPDDQSIRRVLASPRHTLFHCPAQTAVAHPSPALKKQPKPPRAGDMLLA